MTPTEFVEKLPAEFANSAPYMHVFNGKIVGDAPIEVAHEAAKAAHYSAVYGFDAKRNPKTGEFVQQGVGAPGRENFNHFQAIRRYQGEKAYLTAVREIWQRDPDRARKLGLPQPERLGS
jgi:hypothetical protein